MYKKIITIASCVALLGAAATASASITAAEADRLGKDLTPLGAIKAGNADGSIPDWAGGLTTPLNGWPNDDNYRPNPHADDKALFTITAQNMDQYAAKLPDAAKAMFKSYPDIFKMKVYPSRRTAAFPQWYYDAIKKNATTATLINDGNGVDVWGSIPFPIPQSGIEVIWNHMLRFQGVSRVATMNESIVYSNGNRTNNMSENQVHYPFYDPNNVDQHRAEGNIFKFNMTTIEPPRDSGSGLMAIDNIDPVKSPRKAWQYDPGERRVRRAPNLAFDTPDLALNVIDDFEMFSGSPERYDWKLVGKKEMYIPYNNNEANSPRRELDAAVAAGFLDAEMLRYELHRVWIVEATLKEGKRHLYAKRVFYIDEDTWNIMASDKYDGSGNLWRVAFAFPLVAGEIPLTGSGSYAHVDLKKNGYYYAVHTIGTKGYNFEQEPPKANFYTPSALRRRGR